MTPPPTTGPACAEHRPEPYAEMSRADLLLASLSATAVGGAAFWVAVLGFAAYGWALFLLTPVLMGFVAAAGPTG